MDGGTAFCSAASSRLAGLHNGQFTRAGSVLCETSSHACYACLGAACRMGSGDAAAGPRARARARVGRVSVRERVKDGWTAGRRAGKAWEGAI